MSTPNSIIKKDKTADQILDKIMDMLIDGTLKMGDRLNSEQLAKNLEISRSPVREALTVLVQRGLATYVPNCGMRLAELSDDEVIEIYRFRQIIEAQAAYYAALAATEEDIANIERGFQEHAALLATETVSPKEVHKANRRFHMAIFTASRKDFFLDSIERAWDNLTLVKMLYGSSFLASAENRRMLVNEHRLLVDYIKAHNAHAVKNLVGVMIEDKIRIYKEQNGYTGSEKL